MKDWQEIEVAEERLRQRIRSLEDGARLAFFKETEGRLKDPDTYAVLNYLFIAGLHHFYLDRWQKGLLNITIFWLGVMLSVFGHMLIGGALILAISLVELWELFQAQRIVQAYNNKIQEDVYWCMHQRLHSMS